MQVPSEVLDLCMHESSAPVAHAIDGDNMAVTVLLRGYDRNDGTVVTLPRLLANMFNEIVAVVKASADNGNTQHQRLYYVEAISNMLLTYLDLSKVADRSVTPWS
jgi:hypothetical protein